MIAHPVNTVGRREEMVSYMINQGVAGLEVFSSYHSQPDIDYYKELYSFIQKKRVKALFLLCIKKVKNL